LKELWKESKSYDKWINEINKTKSIIEHHLETESPERAPKKKRLPRKIAKLVEYYLTYKEPKVEKKIIEKLSNIDDPNDPGLVTDYDLPLNLAVKSGIPKAINLLIEKGADVNAQSIYGSKALSLACSIGDLSAVKLLLDSGANLFEIYPMYDEEGNLKEERKVCVAILSASRQENSELIELLIDYGADIEETDQNGETLLHKSAETGNLKLLEYLISRGLDVNKNKGSESDKWQGESPLHYAVNKEQLSAARLLIKHGANVNALEYFIGLKHTWFNTPLDLLSEKKDCELYHFLKSKGALKSCEMDEPNRIPNSTPDNIG